MSVYVKGGFASLHVDYTVAGSYADPDVVELRVTAPTGAVTTPSPTRDDTGRYSSQLALTEAGLWRWEFQSTGPAAGTRTGSLLARDNAVTGRDHIPLDELETALGRDLTPVEADRVEQLTEQLLEVLELKLNKWLWPRQVTETVTIGPSQRLRLTRGPVRSVESVSVDGVLATAAYTDPLTYVWGEGTVVTVIYTAGRDMDAAVRGVVGDVLLRTVAAGGFATGAIKSFSVEGTSITYGDVATGGDKGSGRLSVGDVRSIGRLRRPVFVL